MGWVETILIVYVDGIILIGDNMTEIERLMKVLPTKFEVRDSRKMWYFLGMKISRSKKGIKCLLMKICY